YGAMVKAVLGDVPTRSGYLFPGCALRKHPGARHERPELPAGFFTGWSRGKQNFDKRCSIDHWQIHDLRRTFSTGLAALGVPQVVVEKLLNHVAGSSQSQIARIYNRHQYSGEMRSAIA